MKSKSRNPFVLVAKAQSLKTPKADAITIYGPLSHTSAILLSQEWQEKGHWVSVRFAFTPDPEHPEVQSPRPEGEG